MGNKRNRSKPKRNPQPVSKSISKSKGKPIDRWLAIVGVAVAILLFLFAKSPLAVSVSVVFLFVLLLHPVWNFWWIEDYIGRRIGAVLLLAIACGLIAYAAWPMKGEERTALVSGTTEQKIDEIARLLKDQGENVSREKLLKRYPLGYVIFDIGYTNSVFPYDKQLLDEYEIDWSRVGFSKITADQFEIRLPNVRRKDQKEGFIVQDAVIGGRPRVGSEYGGFSTGGLEVWGEIVAIRETGIVFVVGFKKERLHLPTPKPSPPFM
jgi:hypothetical protein